MPNLPRLDDLERLRNEILASKGTASTATDSETDRAHEQPL